MRQSTVAQLNKRTHRRAWVERVVAALIGALISAAATYAATHGG